MILVLIIISESSEKIAQNELIFHNRILLFVNHQNSLVISLKIILLVKKIPDISSR